MVKAPLVIPDVEFGEAFLKDLDAANYPIYRCRVGKGQRRLVEISPWDAALR